MTYDAKAVANELLDCTDQIGDLTNFRLQKFVFLAHGWFLAITGRPLLDEMVEAWRHGPVISSLYHHFKEYLDGPIQRYAVEYDPDEHDFFTPGIPRQDQLTHDVIDKVCEVYGNYSNSQLYDFVHEPKGPWAAVFDNRIKNLQIPNETIRDYFTGWARDHGRNR